MKRPFSQRVRFYLANGRWPKLEARMLLAMVAAAITTPPEPPSEASLGSALTSGRRER